MKKLFLGLIATVLACLSIVSCEKEGIEVKETTTNHNANRWYVHYMHWDEWGRASRSCAGWGLCNFDDCWFCEIDDRPNSHVGKVVFDKETGEGNVFIELDLSEEQQREAINNRLPFYVDDDIDKPNSILRKGVYDFQPNIGKYGGYQLKITVKL